VVVVSASLNPLDQRPAMMPPPPEAANDGCGIADAVIPTDVPIGRGIALTPGRGFRPPGPPACLTRRFADRRRSDHPWQARNFLR